MQFRHYKGGVYDFVTDATMDAAFLAPTIHQIYRGGDWFVTEATMEADHTPLIVYRAANGEVRVRAKASGLTAVAEGTPMIIYRAADGSVWCRTKAVFFEMVEVEGTLVQRFVATSSAKPTSPAL